MIDIILTVLLILLAIVFLLNVYFDSNNDEL